VAVEKLASAKLAEIGTRQDALQSKRPVIAV
jgi:hypothetical protein